MNKKNKSNLGKMREWVLCIVAAFIIVSFLNSEVYALTQVKQYSMENTLVEGERLYIDKVNYHFSEPKAGDIIVFLEGETRDNFYERLQYVVKDMEMKIHKETRRNRFVKRVIGVPGDEIDIKDGKVYVNGELIKESYVKGITYKNVQELPMVIPEGKLFVMGDNRERSNDSRAFGLVDYNSIEGQVIFRIWPLNKLGRLK